MLEIDNKFISKLLSEAAENPRLRQNYDMRTSSDDNSQLCSMLFFPVLWFLSIGIRTVPRMSCCFMENWSRSFTRNSDLETALNLEPSVIYEAKDGKYGEDGSEAV